VEILFAIVALSVLIIVHEFGHYICAVATGMKVDRFSVFGIGPVVARLFTWRGTEFVISAIPFGAYVHIVGMEADDSPTMVEGGKPGETYDYDPNDPTLYRNRPIWARMIAILGGPVANYIAAMLIMFGLYMSSVDVTTAVKIDKVVSDTAVSAGLQSGDELVSVGGTTARGEIRDGKYAPAEDRVRAAAGAWSGKTAAIVVIRDGKEVTVDVPISQEGAIGIEMQPISSEKFKAPLGAAAVAAVQWPIIQSADQLKRLKQMITGEVQGKLGGPVAIVKTMAKSAAGGFSYFLKFAALISTVLGLFNLLPLPALDGGRFVFLLWEGVTRRPANRRVEEMIHGVGMLALLGLILYVTVFNDLLG
jgi:regulator of sigma E protease